MSEVKHGGARAGAGAPTKTEVAQSRTMRLTPSDWAKFQSLGGVKWLRKILRSENEKPINK
jgi:hypothetical protein